MTFDEKKIEKKELLLNNTYLGTNLKFDKNMLSWFCNELYAQCVLQEKKLKRYMGIIGTPYIVEI